MSWRRGRDEPGSPVTEPDRVAAELRRIGRQAGLDVVAICDAGPFHDTRRVLHERAAQGWSAGMQFTYRNPERSTNPGATLPGAAAIVVGARRYERRLDRALTGTDAPALRSPEGRVAMYSWVDHYRPLRAALGRWLTTFGATAGGPRCWSTTTPSSIGPPPCGPASAGTGRTPTCCFPVGILVCARLGGHGRSADRGRPTAHARGRRVRVVPALSDGLSDRGTGRAGTARRPALPGLAAAGARRVPGEFRDALGDRLYGCDDCQTAARSTGSPPATPAGGRSARPALGRHPRAAGSPMTTLMDSLGRWYIPGREPRYVRRNALIVLGNTGDPADPAVVAAVTRALADDDPIVRAHAVWAAARLGRRDLLGPSRRRRPAGPSGTDPTGARQGRAGTTRLPVVTRHLLVTNDFPPKIGGIQSYLWELWRRLPPDDVTVLTSPHADATCLTGTALSHRPDPGAGAPAPPGARPAGPATGRRGRRGAVVLDPALPLGLIGPRLGLPYAVVLHGSEVTVPGRLPGTRALLARVLDGRRCSIAAGGYPEAEARRAQQPPSRRSPGSRPASTRLGSCRCRRSSGPAPGPASACPRWARWCSA